MASMELMFELALTTTDQRAFICNYNYVWTLEVVSTTTTQVTVYQPTTGQTLGLNTQWLIYNALRFGANQCVAKSGIYTPSGRDIRAYATTSDCILRGYGLRL